MCIHVSFQITGCGSWSLWSDIFKYHQNYSSMLCSIFNAFDKILVSCLHLIPAQFMLLLQPDSLHSNDPFALLTSSKKSTFFSSMFFSNTYKLLLHLKSMVQLCSCFTWSQMNFLIKFQSFDGTFQSLTFHMSKILTNIWSWASNWGPR